MTVRYPRVLSSSTDMEVCVLFVHIFMFTRCVMDLIKKCYKHNNV